MGGRRHDAAGAPVEHLRGGVCVDHVRPHVPRLWQSVARQHAAPARTEMLAAYPVDVAAVGGTLAQKAGVLLIQATVILAVATDGTVIYIKKWRKVFPGVRGKQLKKKRRASKDHDALIAQFKKMTEETMKLRVTKMPRMEVPVPAIVAQEE